MEIIVRDKDIITGNFEMEDLHTLKNYPIFMGCVNSNFESDIRVDQTWQISKVSGIIQLRKLVPLEILYGQSHNSGSIGSIWMDHHQKFSEYILENNPKNVLEIGGLMVFSLRIVYQKQKFLGLL